MKKEDFQAVCRATPRYMPRFRLTKLLPSGFLASRGVQKGDFYLYHSNGVMIAENRTDSVSAHASHFEFVGYVRVRETESGSFEVIEEGK